MRSRDALIVALRALLLRVMEHPVVQGDALAQVDHLAESGGNGRLILVIDFEHGKRAWCQVLPVQRHGVRHSIDIAEIQ